MIQSPQRAVCFEYRQRLRGGVTGPHLMGARLPGGATLQVVVKLRKPGPGLSQAHFEATSLACELAASMLARHLGLQVPDYYVATIPDQLIRALPEEVRDLFRQNVGENFATAYLPGASVWACSVETRDALVQALENTLMFDALLLNGDRKREKSNLLYDGDRLLLIDHSLAMPTGQFRHRLASNTVYPSECVSGHCAFLSLRQKGREMQHLVGAWNAAVTAQALALVREAIPATWEREAGDLDAIFTFLGQRQAILDETRTTIREALA